jgi:purine-binding chemotaxis protein CheW
VASVPEPILIFEMAGQRFGLPLAAVKELLPMVATTPVPRAAGLEGMVDVRGKVIPVVDLRSFLGLPAKPPHPSDHLIVGWAGDRLVAVRVDRALDLDSQATLAEDDQWSPPAKQGTRVARSKGGLILLPDLKVCLEAMEVPVPAALLPCPPPDAATEDHRDLDPSHL